MRRMKAGRGSLFSSTWYSRMIAQRASECVAEGDEIDFVDGQVRGQAAEQTLCLCMELATTGEKEQFFFEKKNQKTFTLLVHACG
jgi:hypothetical protein